MAQILESITARRARRAITNQPIDRARLGVLLRAAHLAPSCANNQPWRFVVIDEEPTLAQVKDHLSGGNYWALESPCIVAVISRGDLDCQIPDGRDYYLFDSGLASMNLMLQATKMGLIAHPIAGFKAKPVKDVLSIPDDITLIALIILGYPTSDISALSEKHLLEETSSRCRKHMSDVVSWNHFDSHQMKG